MKTKLTKKEYHKKCDMIDEAIIYYKLITSSIYGKSNKGNVVYDTWTDTWKAAIGYPHGEDQTKWVVWEADNDFELKAKIVTDALMHAANKK